MGHIYFKRNNNTKTIYTLSHKDIPLLFITRYRQPFTDAFKQRTLINRYIIISSHQICDRVHSRGYTAETVCDNLFVLSCKAHTFRQVNYCIPYHYSIQTILVCLSINYLPGRESIQTHPISIRRLTILVMRNTIQGTIKTAAEE